MGQVAINVNGRLYRFDCGEGEEQRLRELAAYVKGRIESLVKEYGKVGDERLMLTAALLIADELMDARAQLAEMAQQSPEPSDAPNGQITHSGEHGVENEPQTESSEPELELEPEPEPAEPPRKVAGGEA
jgi:cell division protein ZapA